MRQFDNNNHNNNIGWYLFQHFPFLCSGETSKQFFEKHFVSPSLSLLQVKTNCFCCCYYCNCIVVVVVVADASKLLSVGRAENARKIIMTRRVPRGVWVTNAKWFCSHCRARPLSHSYNFSLTKYEQTVLQLIYSCHCSCNYYNSSAQRFSQPTATCRMRNEQFAHSKIE